jgi:Fe-S cluster assembly iron-binding protein IscA
VLDLSFALDRDKYNYYGYDRDFYNYDMTDLKQVFMNIGAKATFAPRIESKAAIQYKIDAYTGLYTDRYRAGEYTCKINAPISKQLKPDLLAQSDFLLDANVYFVKNHTTQSNSLIAWQPAVTKQLAKLKIKAGLYPTLGDRFYLLPDILLQYPLNNKPLFVELALQSTLHLNTFKQLTTLNPFLFNYVQTKQTKNTEVFAALNGNFSANCSFTFRSGIALINNLPLFLNDTSFDNKQFNVLYEKQASAFLLDASIDYTIHSEMLAGAKLNIRPLLGTLASKEAWHYVPSTLSFYGKIRATKDVVLRADLFLMAGSKVIERNSLIANAYPKTLRPGMDFTVSANYRISKKWNALIDINNLFGSRYQRWYGYPMYGTNVMLGVIHSFKHIKLPD